MAISKRLRFEILRRDEHTCQYCGQMAPDVRLTVDHVKPVALGGKDSPDNLVSACVDCNSGKSSTNLDAPVVEAIAKRNLDWEERAAMMSAKMRGTLERDQMYVDDFEYEWRVGLDETGRNAELPYGHRATLMHWAEIGVPPEALAQFVQIAMSKPRISDEDVFTYLCGIVWSRIKQADIPLELPEDPEMYTEADMQSQWSQAWDHGRRQVYANPDHLLSTFDLAAVVPDHRLPMRMNHLVQHYPPFSHRYQEH